MALLLVGALIVSACSAVSESLDPEGALAGGSSTTSQETSEFESETDGLPSDGLPGDGVPGELLPDEEVAGRIAALAGQLAIGYGPELFVSRPDGQLVQFLDGSESVVAAQPTWSRDGSSLAWSSVSAQRQVVVIQGFGQDGMASAEQRASNAAGNPVFYLQWNEGNKRLVYIRDSGAGQMVEVGIIEAGSPIEPKGTGTPFFVSWSPEPDRILGHVGERSIDLLDVSQGADGFVAVGDVSGGFTAPAWIDADTAVIATGGALALLDVGTGVRRELINVPGPIRFVVSPDRTKVAYQALGQGGGSLAIGQRSGPDRPGSPAGLIAVDSQGQSVDPGGLNIVELETGNEVTVTSDQALAWEWSPDSENLAWLALQRASDRPIARWFFWSERDGSMIGQGADFAISRKSTQFYLPFFAQYTQSVTGWDPDSSAFAFAGSVNGRSGVWIQLVGQAVPPVRVADGDFVTWGSGPAPPPQSAGASAA